VWDSDPIERRWQTRMELFEYWYSHGNAGQAQAELLALAATTPATDYQRLTRIGMLELKVGNPRQALAQFQMALKVERQLPAALAGAGEAEFDSGAYREAIPYLEEAVRLDRENKEAAAELEVVRLVLADDPFALGIGEREKIARAVGAFQRVQSMLLACALRRGVDVEAANPENDLQRAWAHARQLQPMARSLRRQPENVLIVMNFVFATENLAAGPCGPLEGKDQALWLIGKRHQLEAEQP
jgi:tetratricopeptide (TPR) repeat protein